MEDNYRVNLPVFQGPLDLLLSLIERDELEITRVSLAQVTDQYLAYLEQIEEMRPDFLADFLVIAAKLLLIKSQALLPRPPAASPEAELDPGEELAQQLRLYKQFKTAALHLEERQKQGWRTFIRLAAPPKVESQPDLSEITLENLLAAVQQALLVAPAMPTVDQIVSRRHITIKGQMGLIHQRLSEHRQIIFQEMLTSAQDRLEIAVTLLAILELLKQREIIVIQETTFGKILIMLMPASTDPSA